MEDQASATDIARNFKSYSFFHGAKSDLDALKICAEGFQREYSDEEGRWFRDGNLGIGTYLTCNWQMALWFGNALLHQTLQPGTIVLDTSIEPDPKIMGYLGKKFGRELLTSGNPQGVLPRNKHLSRKEAVTLARYHYREAWEKLSENDAMVWRKKQTNQRRHHLTALKSCVNLLKQAGFHGYGNPNDDNGILIFEPSRIVGSQMIACVPFQDHPKLLDSLQVKSVMTLGAMIAKYPSTGVQLSTET